jgi:hypothetical protein
LFRFLRTVLHITNEIYFGGYGKLFCLHLIAAISSVVLHASTFSHEAHTIKQYVGVAFVSLSSILQTDQ